MGIFQELSGLASRLNPQEQGQDQCVKIQKNELFNQVWECTQRNSSPTSLVLRLENKFAEGTSAPDVLGIYHAKRPEIEACHSSHPKSRKDWGSNP